MKKLLLLTSLLLIAIHPTSSTAHESDWQRVYCEGMQLEQHLPRVVTLIA